MPDSSDNKNEALSRIAPKRKGVEESINPYAKKKLPESEGISIARPPKPKTQKEEKLNTAPQPDKIEQEAKTIEPHEQEQVLANVAEVVDDASYDDDYEGTQEEELNNIIKDVKSSKPKRYKKVLLYSFMFCLLLTLGFCLYFFFLRAKPNIYSKLNSVTYNQNSISFSYKYPALLSKTGALTTKNPDILSAYDGVEGPDNILVDVSALPDVKVLSSLKLTPSDLLSQVRSGHGSYIAYLDQLYPNNYTSLFGKCFSDMVNANNQEVVVCSDNTDGYSNTRLVGVDKNYLYIFQLYMSSPAWENNQNVWKQVEKSFNW